ncbi:MAG: hypothetical protein DHS20C01_31890 [marine bacterium B5-7]|nr:MAG: hypothetical protein DHS20C01_31890 [marine bacterium B5-7]
MAEYLLWMIAGSIYGVIIGIVPAVGATTGLLAIFSFISYFDSTPYLGVVFCMAAVAGSTTCDTYSSILLGIPGANSAAASIVDGYPLSRQGRAIYALSAAIFTSTLSGVFWGCLVFLFLPYYSQIVLYFGVPELWALTILALVSVSLLVSRHKIRSVLAILLGLFIGSIGTDPVTASSRFTFGWFYLADGVQLVPLVAGLFAVPELIEGIRRKNNLFIPSDSYRNQTRDGLKAVWHNRWLAMRGGAIGAIIGALPGLGGAIADWLSYSHAVAANRGEQFGHGNIKGVIGPEGANNAQKATSMIPTVLFGIPGAPFAAVLMGLFSYLNIEMGSIYLLEDREFFAAMAFGFLAASVLVMFICLFINRYLELLTAIPFKYYSMVVFAIIVWACVQYTGGWEDYAMLAIASVLGMLCKHYRFSRPSLLVAYILSYKVETLSLQTYTLYSATDVIQRPGFLVISAITLFLLYYGVTRNERIDFV